MADKVTQEITAFIKGRYPKAEISDTDNIFSLGYINSLFAMELVMFLEKTYELTIPNDELRSETFRTVESMARLVARHRRTDVPIG